MQPLHIKIQNIEKKLDEILSYVKPVTPVQEEINLQEQLNIALAQIEGLRQALVEKAQGLQTEVTQMKSVVTPLKEPVISVE